MPDCNEAFGYWQQGRCDDADPDRYCAYIDVVGVEYGSDGRHRHFQDRSELVWTAAGYDAMHVEAVLGCNVAAYSYYLDGSTWKLKLDELDVANGSLVLAKWDENLTGNTSITSSVTPNVTVHKANNSEGNGQALVPVSFSDYTKSSLGADRLYWLQLRDFTNGAIVHEGQIRFSDENVGTGEPSRLGNGSLVAIPIDEDHILIEWLGTPFYEDLTVDATNWTSQSGAPNNERAVLFWNAGGGRWEAGDFDDCASDSYRADGSVSGFAVLDGDVYTEAENDAGDESWLVERSFPPTVGNKCGWSVVHKIEDHDTASFEGHAYGLSVHCDKVYAVGDVEDTDSDLAGQIHRWNPDASTHDEYQLAGVNVGPYQYVVRDTFPGGDELRTQTDPDSLVRDCFGLCGDRQPIPPGEPACCDSGGIVVGVTDVIRFTAQNPGERPACDPSGTVCPDEQYLTMNVDVTYNPIGCTDDELKQPTITILNWNFQEITPCDEDQQSLSPVGPTEPVDDLWTGTSIRRRFTICFPDDADEPDICGWVAVQVETVQGCKFSKLLRFAGSFDDCGG